MISISANLNIMIKAAEKASKSVIRDFGEVEKLQVSKKGPYDFVTKTDKYVEKVLIEELAMRGIPVIAFDPQGDISSLAVLADDSNANQLNDSKNYKDNVEAYL